MQKVVLGVQFSILYEYSLNFGIKVMTMIYRMDKLRQQTDDFGH